LKAPLIAVISVGIAAAAPAVAVSATDKAGAAVEQKRAAPASANNERPLVKTDLNEPVGRVTLETPTQASQITHKRLVRRFLGLRNRANRLIAKRDHGKARLVRDAVQVRWSNHGLRRAIRRLRRQIRRVRAVLRDRRAGLTPAVRGVLNRIAFCESKGNPRAIGGGGSFRGKYQFTYGTWQSVGGKGDPAAASEAEQDRRAAMLLKRSGSSPWPVCG
jgi:hypothetical protein